MATASVRRTPPGQQLLLYGVDWKTYTRLLRVFAERPSVRLTYDRGTLEIMSPTFKHDLEAYLLGRFIDALTEELGLPVEGGGSATLRRRRKQRGLEPDRCYWIAHASQVRGKDKIDLRVDPPPDLALEVDVTHSSLDRLGIYAALKVPEVWRMAGGKLTFHVLGPDGKYAASPHSLAFPLVAPDDLLGFLAQRSTLDNNAVVARLRAWVRQRRGAGAQP